MEVSGANPFLMMGADDAGGGVGTTTISSSSSQSNLNPFLMDDISGFGDGGGDNIFGDNTMVDNPFFSTSVTAPTTTAQNPFAFDAMDDYEATTAITTSSTTTTTNIFGNDDQSIFTSTIPQQQPQLINNDDDFMSSEDNTAIITPIKQVIPPNELNLQNTTSSSSSNNENNKPKVRPPPPRPPAPPPIASTTTATTIINDSGAINVPVSKDTKDLITSFTDTMDTQTTYLLDCIPRTRTPSPISMRDLHSPSPINLLDQGDGVADTTGGVEVGAIDDLVDVGNFSANIQQSQPQKPQQFNLFDIENDDFSVNTTAPQSVATTTVTTTITNQQQQQSLLFENDDFMATSTTITTTTTAPTTIEKPNVCDINQNQPPNNSSIQQPTRPPPPRPGPPPKPPLPRVIQQQQPPQPQPQTTISNNFNNNNVNNNNSNSNINAQQTTTTTATPAPTRPTPPKPPLPKVIQQQQPPPRPISPINDLTKTTTANNIFTPPTTEIINEANILDTTITTTATLDQVDNSNTNPFSFQDDTKLVDTLTNTSTITTTTTTVNDNDDFMLSTAAPTATTTTTATQFIDNIFDAPPKEEPTKTVTSNNDVFNNIFEQQQQQTTTVGGFNDLFGGSGGGSTENIDQQSTLQDQIFNNTNTNIIQTSKPQSILEKFQRQSEEFDAFAAKFESAKDNISTGAANGGSSAFGSNNNFDAFGGTGGGNASAGGDAWGDTNINTGSGGDKMGFGVDDDEPFDSFLSLSAPPPAVPQSTPARSTKLDSDSDDDKDFAVFIKPKNLDLSSTIAGDNVSIGSGFVPTLAPPPKSPQQSAISSAISSDTSPRFNPFDQQEQQFGDFTGIPPQSAVIDGGLPQGLPQLERTDSQETPPTPLFDEDTSQPLEEFPRIHYKGEGWEMQLRQPNKKKITGQRFWKKIFIKMVYQGDNPVLQLYNADKTDKDPFQELPLQACYSVSEIGAQQYDQFGKIFTIKLQYIFYKERPGVRPGQVTKAERITNKLSQFAAYAIQGDYQGVKEFGSDLKKLGLPVEHAPQISQLFKIGSQTYEHMKEFSMMIEEALFRLTVHRDRALHYKMEEVQITAVDEIYVEQNADGGVDKQIARVRVFFLGFLSGMPDIELGVNDMRRQGKEVVGRHDIIPVVTEEWIRIENYEFHACVQQEEYQKSHIIRFKPPDACYIELMRFRVRPPKNRELPLQLKAVMCVTGNKVELRADVLVPGFASRKLGQVPCEDVMIRFPIPECWIYLFRVEKHFRYGSVKSAHRRTGKIKGIERFLGTVETLQESLIEVTSGQAKYEHQHRSIVWRCPRLPKEGQGAYTTHNLVCRMALTSFDQIPEQLSEYAYVEFTMPATQVSHTTIRSVSVQGSDSDEPPEKYVRYLARHEYRVGIEHTKGDSPNAYAAATVVRPPPIVESTSPVPPVAESSDSDSD